MLSLEGLMQVVARLGGGTVGDRIDPKWLLVLAQGLLVVGLLALARATTGPLLVLYAVGVGVGFGLTVLAVSLLLLNYFGPARQCRAVFPDLPGRGAVGGGTGDRRPHARPVGNLRPDLPAVRGGDGGGVRGGAVHAAAQGWSLELNRLHHEKGRLDDAEAAPSLGLEIPA